MSSVRFICGTQEEHKELEKRLAAWIGTEDCILYPSCFDANGGVFEPLLGTQDAIISDALNHASIIDGIRLSKARRFRYVHSDMADLERKLAEARSRIDLTGKPIVGIANTWIECMPCNYHLRDLAVDVMAAFECEDRNI